MTWVELLRGLADLPAALRELKALQQTQSVSIASVSKDDVIVIESDRILGTQARQNLDAMAKAVWPNIDSGLKVRVMKAEDAA